MSWHVAPHDTQYTSPDNITSPSTFPCLALHQKDSRATGEAGQVPRDVSAPQSTLTSPQDEFTAAKQGVLPPARRAALPRSCRKPTPPTKSKEPLFEPLAPRLTLARSPFQLVAYSAHAPVQRKALTVDRAQCESTSTELRYRIMGKATDAKANSASRSSPKLDAPRGLKHGEEGHAGDVHLLHPSDAGGDPISRHPTDAPERGRGESSSHHAQECQTLPPASLAHTAACDLSLKCCVCSICGVLTAKADMTARTHCKSCSKLCTCLRSRHGKLKYLYAAFQQLGSTTDHAAVLEVATQLVQHDTAASVTQNGTNISDDFRQQCAKVLRNKQQCQTQAFCKSEVAEPIPEEVVPARANNKASLPGTAKRESMRVGHRGHKSSTRNAEKVPKVKCEIHAMNGDTRQADESVSQAPEVVVMQDLCCSVCGCKFKAEKKAGPTLCTNCVVCYRRAREQSYTILELKNAVTGGYVLPKEEPTAPEIRSAIGRMLLGQPKAKPGADRDSRAARRTCSAAAVRGAGGDEGRPVKHTIPRLDLDQRQVIVNRASGRNNDVRCRGHAASMPASGSYTGCQEGADKHTPDFAEPRNVQSGHCQDSIKNDTCRWQGPSTLTHTTAVASAGTSQGSEPSTMRAATPGSQGAGVAPDIAAAGSGTDATAAGFGYNGQQANEEEHPLPDMLPPGWERQISQMIQDAVHQKGLNNSALIECITRNANEVAKAVFNSQFVQATAPWTDGSAGSGPAPAHERDSSAGQGKMTACSPDQLLATGYGDSVCGKRTRVADHAPEGMMNAAVKALRGEGIEINDQVNKILSVSIPAVKAYLNPRERT